MSERSENDVLALIDRAAAHTPPLHLDRGDVVARGEQIVRRRRAGAGGMAVAAVALAGTVWLGLGGGSLLGSPEVLPASVTWEVDGPTTLTLLDDVPMGEQVLSVTVTKEGDRATGTMTVDGVEETVEGTTMRGGADVFVGEHATAVVWEQPRRATHAELVPERDEGSTTGGAVGEGGLHYEVSTDPGYRPTDLVLSTDRAVWTAGGEVAETGTVSDGRRTTTVFALPEAGLAGYVEEGGGVGVMEPDGLLTRGDTEPWGRGGEHDTSYLMRAYDEARYVRLVESDVEDGVVDRGERVEVTRVGDAAFAVLSSTQEEMAGDGADHVVDVQWSRDGQTWHDRDVDPADLPADDPAVEEGGHVTLLGDSYEVGVDQRGWPMLLEADGTTFLSLDTDDGPSVAAGGVVMWREHWWPWSARNAVLFYVGWEPPAGAEVVVRGEGGGDGPWFEPQDVVTITGPEGVVTLVSIPAGDDRPDVTGLGLRDGDHVRPVTPD